jgi:hypothetical protein
MIQLHSLETSMADARSDIHTVYLVPGSRTMPPWGAEATQLDRVGTVLMWTSFNLSLNWYPVYHWYSQEKLGVVFGADHMYKFDADGTSHLTQYHHDCS